MKGLQLAVVIVLGIGTSTAFAFVVGAACAWRTHQPPPEIRIRYVERVKPTPSASPTTPKAELLAR